MKRRTERLPCYSLALFVLLGAGYLATLLPGIGYSGDAIKFQYLGKVLGVPHAPGYPLYLMLNHLFVTLFPFGSVAYKANLLSAIYAVGACFMLFKLLLLLGTGRIVALVTALAFGFSKAFWSQAIVSEVYSLLIFFMALVVYFLVKWHLKRRDRDFYIATALYAFSFGNHLLAITLLPAFVYLVLATDRSVFVNPKKVLWVVSVVALGALQYLYLFWRLNDPQTPYVEGFNGPNFFYYVTGGPFRPLMFAFTPAEVVGQRIPLFLSFMRDNLPVLSLAAVAGVFVGRVPRAVRVFLLVYFLANAFYAVNYNIPDIDGYFLANDLVVAVFVGLALERLLNWRQGASRRWVVGFLLLVPLIYFGARYPLVNLSGSTGQREGVERALEAVGSDAVIITSDYPSGQGFLYYLLAEGLGVERNLHVVNFGRNRERLRAYLDADGTLHPFVRRTAQAMEPGLPLFAYPCEERRFTPLGLRVLQEDAPRLCRLEPLSLELSPTSNLEQDGLALEGLTEIGGDEDFSWRWGLGPATQLAFYLDEAQPLTLSLSLSTPFRGQRVSLEVNGEVRERFSLEENEVSDHTIQVAGRTGQNKIILHYTAWNHHPTAHFPKTQQPLAVQFERIRLERVQLEGARSGSVVR